MLQGFAGTKLEGPKPNWRSVWLLPAKTIKMFLEIHEKGRIKENLHTLLDVEGNILRRDEEKTEVFNAFFASAFSSKTSCSPGTQPLSW